MYLFDEDLKPDREASRIISDEVGDEQWWAKLQLLRYKVPTYSN
jgi:hypothetical protein